MSNFIAFTVKEETKRKIDRLVHLTGEQSEVVVRDLVEIGLQNYKASPTKSAKAVLDLIAWAEKEQITGKENDLSTNHNKYAWDE
jgi:hypothetical protein